MFTESEVRQGLVGVIMGFNVYLCNQMPKLSTTDSNFSTVTTGGVSVLLAYLKPAFGWGRTSKVASVTFVPDEADTIREIEKIGLFVGGQILVPQMAQVLKRA